MKGILTVASLFLVATSGLGAHSALAKNATTTLDCKESHNYPAVINQNVVVNDGFECRLNAVTVNGNIDVRPGGKLYFGQYFEGCHCESTNIVNGNVRIQGELGNLAEFGIGVSACGGQATTVTIGSSSKPKSLSIDYASVYQDAAFLEDVITVNGNVSITNSGREEGSPIYRLNVNRTGSPPKNGNLYCQDNNAWLFLNIFIGGNPPGAGDHSCYQ